MSFLFDFLEIAWIDFFSIWICWCLKIVLIDIVSIWIFWNVLNWFLIYLATGVSLAHPLPTRPLFWRKRFTYQITLFGCFDFFLIDLFLVWMFRNALVWFVSIWIFWSILNWFLSTWLLKHPWGTLCQPAPLLKKAIYLSTYSIWIVWDGLNWLLFYLDFLETALIDFFSIWMVWNVLTRFLFGSD